MAETALSMAKSMLGSAVSKVASAASTEISLLMGMQKEMWFIKDELKTMQAFLEAPQVTEKKDKLVKVWAEQVRDLSYDIEDCLDEFMVHVGNHKLSKQLMKLKDRHRIAIRIRNIKSRIEEVSSRNARYNLIKTESSNTADMMDSYMDDIRNQSSSNIDEAELVGFAGPKTELIKLLETNTMDGGPAKVICVVGMGGLGKTTLARKTYESKDYIVKNFPYRAWITVSQSFSKRTMLEDMIKEFFGANTLQSLFKEHEAKMLREGDLAIHLRAKLQDKRYLIVLDDLWNIHDWNWIREIALPRNNNTGSRIIITTRDAGLARQCSTSELLIYKLEPLEIGDAEKLLLRRTNRRQEDMEIDEVMRNIVTRLVKRCGCLPLPILTIGGVLATKKTSEWENFYKELPLELESNQSLAVVHRMVTLSYNYLPSHLKLCFLYLSVFPEDFEIRRRHLIDRWIAEGFVSAKVGMTIGDVGESYFNELVNRSMILPAGVNIEGNVKSCRVHDIVRDVIVSFSREENFACFIQGDGSNVQEENFRHIAYLDIECPKETMDWSHIRSLTFFTDEFMDLTPICSAKFRMLRVLDLVGEHFGITQNGMDSIMLCFHLKYLNVKTSQSLIYSVPRSISKVKGLQILEMGFCYITTLPTEITKLRNLRAIRCTRSAYDIFDPDEPAVCMLATLCLPVLMTLSRARARAIADLHMGCSSRWSQSDGVTVPRGIGSLKELQVLETVDIRRTCSKAVKELAELTQLRKLVVLTEGTTNEKCKMLSASIEKLSSLRSLRVIADERQDRGGLEWLVSSSSSPPHLRSLKLKGYIGKMTDWFRNLTQLVKIYLSRSQLKDDKTMKILGELPKLMLLRIGPGAYLGEKLVFGTGTFLNLRKLWIWDLKNLIEMRFEEGTSPQMEMVEIGYCYLASGIIGIKHLPRLKEISLGCVSQVARLGMLEDEVNGHHNHPVLRLAFGRNMQDLGDVGGSNVEIQAMESVADQAGESSQVITLPTTDSEIQPASS